MAEVFTLQEPEVGYDHSDFLPTIVRIIDITRVTNDRGLVDNRAKIVGAYFEATLSWTTQHADIWIRKGSLARVLWPQHLIQCNGAYPVNRLVHLETVEHDLNLFETIPGCWLNDVELRERAKQLWTQLPPPMRAFFNELFWDCNRFQRYATVPASLAGHHNHWNGTFRHSVDVAEHAERIALEVPGISTDLLILAALIHDAGKADEFRWTHKKWERTETGILIGYKDSLKAWIGAIFESSPHLLTESQRLGLWHILFSVPRASDTLQLGDVRMLEAEILAMADRISGAVDLHRQAGNPAGGFGKIHGCLNGRPYRLPA